MFSAWSPRSEDTLASFLASLWWTQFLSSATSPSGFWLPQNQRNDISFKRFLRIFRVFQGLCQWHNVTYKEKHPKNPWPTRFKLVSRLVHLLRIRREYNLIQMSRTWEWTISDSTHEWSAQFCSVVPVIRLGTSIFRSGRFIPLYRNTNTLIQTQIRKDKNIQIRSVFQLSYGGQVFLAPGVCLGPLYTLIFMEHS